MALALFLFLPIQALAGHPAPFYQRATNEFQTATFLKPAGQKTNDLTFTLAPLIIQEQRPPSVPPPPAAPERGERGSATNLESTSVHQPSTIHVTTDTLQFNGKPHPRLTYLWSYPSANLGLPLQGIRITLDPSGQPVIWEILADTSGAALIFVSQTLEAAAKAAFGPPLPGRKYSIERSPTEAPNVIVPRILDDGPVPMGPIVYLRADTHDVSTLICRCMPAQAKKLLSTGTYTLVPSSGPPVQKPSHPAPPVAFWPNDPTTDLRLQKLLRLPPNF